MPDPGGDGDMPNPGRIWGEKNFILSCGSPRRTVMKKF